MTAPRTGPTDTMHELIMEAIEDLKTDVRDLVQAVNGNGHPGIKGRLTRLETILTIVGAIAVVGTSMASCAIGAKMITVPVAQAQTK